MHIFLGGYILAENAKLIGIGIMWYNSHSKYQPLLMRLPCVYLSPIVHINYFQYLCNRNQPHGGKECATGFTIHITPYLIAFAIYSVFVAECRKF